MAIRKSDGMLNALATGGSDFSTLFAECVIHIFSGTPPTDANSTETGTLLAILSDAGAAFTPGVAANGLNFNTLIGGGLLSVDPTETIREDSILASATATWFRVYSNAVSTGDDTSADPEDRTKVRFDGIISTVNGADMVLKDTALTAGLPLELAYFKIQL
jgi:hypothetical protein